MDPLIASQNLSVTFTTPLESDFIVDQVDVVEAISALYEVVVHVHTSDTEVSFDDVMGENVSVSITYHDENDDLGDVARVFSGIVGKIHQRQTFVDPEEDGSAVAYYTFYIYPPLWQTNLNQDCRIFQKQAVQDITETLFGEYGIDGATIDIQALPDPKHRYCIQYNESVFNFLSRLWEEEGIGYFFTHDANGTTMTLCTDTPTYAQDIAPDTIALQHYEKSTLVLNAIQNITYEISMKPSQLDTCDYDYAKASTSLSVVLEANEQKGGRVYEYPGRYKQLAKGEKLASQRVEEISWDAAMVTGQSTVPGFIPYGAFTLEHHPRDEWNRRYILYKVVHRLRFNDPKGQNNLVYDNTFWAFPDDIPFRPKRLTPKPRILSQQTAVVVGPEGEEIYTDAQGCIRIQFPWDLYGDNSDASSLWVRVAQTWAGPGWGALVTPRVGMEVVVSFIDGDPDRPLVTGCVYNSDNPAPDEVASPTRSIWRTQSSPDAEGFNEMSFEDSAGAEEIFFHAQKDWKTVIQNSREELIVDSDDTLTLTNGSRYASFHGTGINDNVLVDDGCHKYAITAGDFTIILGSAAAAAAAGVGDDSETPDATCETTSGGGGGGGSGGDSGEDEGSSDEEADSSEGDSGGDEGESSSGGDGADEEDAEGITASGVVDTPDAAGTSNTGGDFTLFMEQGDSTITLSKGDYTILLTEGDDTLTLTSGDYTITLSSGDLTINVTGDISVTCSGDMSFDAGGDIDITAGGDISMTATSIDMTAKLDIGGMAGLAVSWMAGLAVDGMAGLAHCGMALLMNENMALLLAETKGLAMGKLGGAACSINMP